MRTMRFSAAAAALAAAMLLGGHGVPIAARQQAGEPSEAGGSMLVYVGTYTGRSGGSRGIYLFRLERHADGPSGAATLVPAGLVAETPNPSYLAVDARRRFLFAVNEVSEFQGERTGAVSAFSLDPDTGRLTLLNQRASKGTGPCHLLLDREGRNLLVANYGSGTVAVLPVGADGRLGEATSVVQHTGSSINPQRQKGPHAHCTVLDPANRFAFACDLGIDKVLTYRFDAGEGRLTPAEPAFTAAKPGSGPRSMAFRPDGRFAYVGNELNSTISAYAVDASTGALREVQTVSSLPPGFEGANSIAEVGMHPSGQFLYVSNRGHNSVVLFAVGTDGTLTYVGEQSTGGKTPRHFGMDPSGTHLVIANQDSDSLLVTRIDAATGRLTPAASPVPAPTPVFVKFVPVPRTGK